MITCSSCGAGNPQTAKFCNECGAKIAASLPEERKTVTVVFCDLVGFTQRSESLDPEDVRGFLVPYYNLLQEEIARYGGVIDKLYGDGAMAVFGAPVAHEDDPERAIRASLKIVERLPLLGLGLEVRVGINTGEVVLAADVAHRGDALTGDTVNTASRIQSAAAVGTVVVGEATFGATAHVFAYETLEPVLVKGKADPVAIFRPLHPIAAVAAEPRDATPFVGREAELALLVESFERARKGEPTFVSVLAEPGNGKSRLVREFARHVDDLPELITWREGRCLPYGDGIAHWALTEIVKAHAGILDSNDDETIARKLDQVLLERDPATRTWLKDRLAPLVGLPTRSETPERQELFTAWRRFVAEFAADGPVVLVIEDLHWADEGLVAFLGSLRTNLEDLPLLVLTTARPELAERHPEWPEQTTQLRLGVLDEVSMRALVGSLLPDASAALASRVLEHANGSPLYAEQFAAMCRSMPITGGSEDDLPIPDSIQALLAARIDLLTDDLKSLLLDASVVGKTFWVGAAAALGNRGVDVTDDGLAALVERSFVREEPTSTIEDDTEYSFVHALVRDVAYGNLSRRSRLEKHRAAAGWITERVGRPLGEIADIVVSHLDRAREAAAAAGLGDDVDAIDLALIDPLFDAGVQAAGSDMQVAAARLLRASDLVPRDDPRRTTVLEAAADAAGYVGELDRAAALWLEAEGIHRSSGDLDGVGRSIRERSTALSNLGQGSAAVATLEAGRDELRDHPGQGLLDVLSGLAEVESMYGDQQAALDQIEAIEALADELHLEVPAYIADAKGGALLGLGDLDGERVCRSYVAAALERGEVGMASISLSNLAVFISPIAGPGRALAIIDEALALAQARGVDPFNAPAFRLLFLYDLGRWDEVIDEGQSLAEVPETPRVEVGKVFARVCIGRGGSYLGLIDPEVLAAEDGQSRRDKILRATLRLMVELAWAETPERGWFEHMLLQGDEPLYPEVLTVDALVRAGWLDLATAAFARWLERFPAFDGRYEWAEALLAEARGDPDASDYLRVVLARAVRLGSVRDEADARFHLGRCEVRQGLAPEATQSLLRSRELWLGMRADARVAEIDQILESLDG